MKTVTGEDFIYLFIYLELNRRKTARPATRATRRGEHALSSFLHFYHHPPPPTENEQPTDLVPNSSASYLGTSASPLLMSNTFSSKFYPVTFLPGNGRCYPLSGPEQNGGWRFWWRFVGVAGGWPS